MANSPRIKFQGIRIITIILVIIGLAACAGNSGSSGQEYVENAKKFLAENDLAAAILELKNALKASSDNAEARYLHGKAGIVIGDGWGAEKDLRYAGKLGWDEATIQVDLGKALLLQDKPEKLIDNIVVKDEYSQDLRAKLFANRAKAYLELNQQAAAEQNLDKALELGPDSPMVLLTLARSRVVKQDKLAAERAFEQIEKLAPNTQELWLLKGQLAFLNLDYSAAEAAYQQAIELKPRNIMTAGGWEALVNHSKTQILLGKIEQASAAVEQLLTEAPKNPEINYLGGVVAFAQEKYEVSEKRLQKVLLSVPNHAPSTLLLGALNYAQKQYEQATYYLSRFLASEPGNLQARKLLGVTHMQLRQHNQAVKTLSPGLTSTVEDAELQAMVGVSVLRSGDVKKGISYLEKAVATSPNSSELRNELARAYIAGGEAERAITELEGVLAQSDQYYEAEYLLVLAYLRQNDLKKAIKVALDLKDTKPDEPIVYNLAGSVIVLSGDLAEGRKLFNQALKIKPGFVLALLNLGRLDQREGDFEQARQRYLSIINNDPNSIPALMSLAQLSQQEGKSPDTVAWLERAHKAQPNELLPRLTLAQHYLHESEITKADKIARGLASTYSHHPDVMMLQGRVFMMAGKYKKALNVFSDLVGTAPQSSIAHYLHALAFSKLGNSQKAVDTLKKTLALQENYLPALVLLSDLEMRLNNYPEAMKLSQKITELHPNLAAGDEIRGGVFMKQGEYTQAFEAFSLAWQKQATGSLAIKRYLASVEVGGDSGYQPLLDWLEHHPDDVGVRLVLANALRMAGSTKQATDQYNRVLALQPENVQALNDLAWIFQEDDRPKALQLAEQAYKLRPDQATIQDTYGWILVQEGQLERGTQILRQASKRLSTVPEVQYHLAVGMFKTGKLNEARMMLAGILDSENDFQGRQQAKILYKKLQ